MSSVAKHLPVTAAEYLEGELRSKERHEFVDGRIYAMSGASRQHNEICLDSVYRRSDGWTRHLHTQFETLIHFESLGFSAPLSAFYQSNPFPQDVQRPWYHLNRVED